MPWGELLTSNSAYGEYPDAKPSVDGSWDIVVLLHNDELTIRQIVNELLSLQSNTPAIRSIILVDSSSPDRCGAIADEISREKPALVRVVHAPIPGYADAVLLGLRSSSASWVAIIDGDREYPVAYLPTLISESERRAVSFVLTKRVHKPYSRYRRIVSAVYNFLVRSLFSVSFSDIGSGLRAYSRPIVDMSAECISRSAFIAAEIPIRASLQGASGAYVEVPLLPELNTHRRSGIVRIGQITRVIREMVKFKLEVSNKGGAWNR